LPLEDGKRRALQLVTFVDLTWVARGLPPDSNHFEALLAVLLIDFLNRR
jgi:hypothetical protein